MKKGMLSSFEKENPWERERESHKLSGIHWKSKKRVLRGVVETQKIHEHSNNLSSPKVFLTFLLFLVCIWIFEFSLVVE